MEEVKKKTMFDILTEYNELLEVIEDEGGELTPEMELDLEIKAEEFEEKLRGYYNFQKFVKGRQKENKETIARLTTRNKNMDNRLQFVKDVVKIALTQHGESKGDGNYKYKAADFSVWTQTDKSFKVNLDYENPNYEKRNISITVPSELKEEIEGILVNFAEAKGISLSEIKMLDSTDNNLLKDDINNGIYYCYNEDCPAYTSGKYDDCKCDDKPKFVTNNGVRFR